MSNKATTTATASSPINMAISTKQSCMPSDVQFFYNWQSPQLQSEAMGFWVRVRLEKRDALFHFLSFKKHILACKSRDKGKAFTSFSCVHTTFQVVLLCW